MSIYLLKCGDSLMSLLLESIRSHFFSEAGPTAARQNDLLSEVKDL